MSIRILQYCIISLFYSCLISCSPVEILLHSDLSGHITDSSTGSPIENAKVQINPLNDSTRTDSEGIYMFENLIPGSYEIEASKYSYNTDRKTVAVTEATAIEANFELKAVPVMEFSTTFLDFSIDSTSVSFTMSNKGTGRLSYMISGNQDWISAYPSMGTIEGETDTIKVMINRNGLSDKIYNEELSVAAFIGKEITMNTIRVLVNGVMVSEGKYIGTVTIGTQTWLAENLNTGVYLHTSKSQTDNGITEKYCVDDNNFNCSIFGGAYQWNEMMQYTPSDNRTIGITRGICPAGWHIPTKAEWTTLVDFLGGESVAGGKLKSLDFWEIPNTGATNESGFGALPVGGISYPSVGYYWSASDYIPSGQTRLRIELSSNSTEVKYSERPPSYVGYLRCIKDP